MPRLPFPDDTDAFSDETRAAVRHILATRGGNRPPPSTYMSYAGDAGIRFPELLDHLRNHTSLTPAESELAICTAARAANADYIWNSHVKLGLAAGVREEALHIIDTYGPLEALEPDEALIVRFGRELLDTRALSDDAFNAVRARFGERGLMEILALMSTYLMNATMLRALEHRAAPDARHLSPRGPAK